MNRLILRQQLHGFKQAASNHSLRYQSGVGLQYTDCNPLAVGNVQTSNISLMVSR